MPNKTWKDAEREFAALFETKRRPLSGGNQGEGRDDIRHPSLFGECKHGKKFSIWSLWDATKKLARKERKIPILGIKQKAKHGMLIIIHSDDLHEVADILVYQDKVGREYHDG